MKHARIPRLRPWQRNNKERIHYIRNMVITEKVVKHPDRSVTIEGLKSYRVSNRRYRNRRIGDFLKELHLTEGRNTGFKKILNALEANGSPMPEFETDEDRTYFITRLFVHEKFYEADERNVIENVIDISEDWLTKRIPNYSKRKLQKRMK